MLIDHTHSSKNIRFRRLKDKLANSLFISVTTIVLLILAVLIIRVFSQGWQTISVDFLMNKLSTDPEQAGILGAVLGTLWLMIVVIPTTMVIGICTAIYLECYTKKGRLNTFIQMNIGNLAGVPSIVYGILGLTIFVRALNFGNVVLAGGLTLSLLVLPIIIVASQEAIQSIPHTLSEASYGIGATKWQTVKNIILPAALPNILTGAILALSRAIGETAPLVVIGIPALLIPFPGSLFDRFTALPMQIYYWTLDASLVAQYANLAAATIIVLLITLLILNGSAILLRQKYKINV